MEVKFERELQREELADYLNSLAAQIRQGELQLPGFVEKLPERGLAEILIKEKKGRLTAKLYLSFATLEHYDQPRRQTVEAVVESFKAVKKRLGASYANLKKTAATNTLPPPEALAEFLRDNQAFAQQADPEWQAEMDIYLDHVKNLEQAYTLGNLEMFIHELADIKISMARCHQEFK